MSGSRLKNLLASALVVVGCKTVDRVYYRHDATADVHQTYDLSKPSYAPYIHGGILIAPFVVPMNHEETAIKLSFVSESGGQVTIHRAKLVSMGPSRTERDIQVDQQTALQAASQAGVFTAEMTLLTLRNEELEQLTEETGFTLTVHSTEPDAQLTYEVLRKTEALVVSP